MTRDDLLKLHEELTGKAQALMTRKNADYTGGGGPFANFDTAQAFNTHRVKGALIRMMDKMQRINSFIERGVLEVTDESVEDTIVDLINYPVLIAGMIREEKEGGIQLVQAKAEDYIAKAAAPKNRGGVLA